MNFQKRILAMLLSVVACVGSVSYAVFASQKDVSNDTAPIYQDTCEHTYQNGVCTICGAEDPHWVVPTDKDILHTVSGINLLHQKQIFTVFKLPGQPISWGIPITL